MRGGGNPQDFYGFQYPVETKGVGNYSSVFGQAVAIAVTIDWVNTFPFMTDDVG